MKRYLSLAPVVALLLLGCGVRNVKQNNSLQEIISEESKPKTVGYVLPQRGIIFFGVKLVGSFPTVLKALDTLTFFDIDKSSEFGYRGEQSTSYWYYASVLVDSIHFGMNVYYPKEGDTDVVKNIVFVTGDTADCIRRKIVEHLIQYYGSPEIDEGDAVATYAWPSRYSLRFRRLHHPDGGWTFFFSL